MPEIDYDLFEAVAEHLHTLQLVCGGPLGDPWDLIVESNRPAHWVNRHRRWVHQHCTDAHRAAVAEFLGRCPGVARFEVGPLVVYAGEDRWVAA